MKTTMMKTAGVALCALTIAALSTTSGHAYATYAKWASNQVVFYANPSNLDIDSTVAETALVSALNNWNTQAGTPFRFSYGGRVNDTSTGYDSRNVMVFRNSSNGSAIATTYSWYSGSTLVDADIVFWDGAFTFTAGDLGCAGAMYIEDVATHELGHSLGLSHSAVGDATMYPYYSACSQELRSLAADDIAGAQALYGTAKSTNSAPTVSITSPTTSTASQGSSILFAGSASDTQDGNLTSQVVWTSSIVGQIGVGGSFTTTLPAGSHVITATVKDSGGLTASKQISLNVTGTANTPPIVSIVSPTGTSFNEGVGINFGGTATDTQDGTITAKLVWMSNLSGQIGTGGSFAATLPAGTHVITASATDNGGATSSQQITLNIAPVVASTSQVPTLNASGYKIKGSQRADLTWSGFATTSIDVYRNGTRVTTTANDGVWTDLINAKGGGTYTYKACGTGTSTCSAQVTVSF